MMGTAAAAIFWMSAVMLVWAYLGYPAFVATLGRKLLPPTTPRPGRVGGTWVMISAYNEEETIEAKVLNALDLRLNAPLHVVVVSDGSTDRTREIVRGLAERDPRVWLVHDARRLGKNGALDRALSILGPDGDDMLLFTDANALFDPDAAARLAEALEDGAACAVGKLQFVDVTTGTARAEGLYWRYENELKRLEGRLGRNAFANGAIFAARAADVPELPPDVGNDFWVPVMLLGQRRGVVYETGALAFEPATRHADEEFRRKVRMANRQMTGVLRSWSRIDAVTRFQLVSHKVVRWLGLPFLVLALGAALLLWHHPVYRLAASAIVAAGALALLATALRPLGIRLPLGSTAAHFFLVQAAALLGVLQAVRGRRQVTWEVAQSARRRID